MNPNKKSYKTAIWCGCLAKCPNCGKGKLFAGYLQIVTVCSVCKAKLGSLPTRDAPIQTTMLLILAIFVPLVLVIEIIYSPAAWVHIFIFAPLMTILTLALLRISKGIIAGILWVLQLHD